MIALKKLLYIFFISILLLNITACSNIKTFQSKKPCNNYYTDLLDKDLKTQNKYLIILLDTQFYKKVTLGQAESDLVKKSLLTLQSANFINKPKDIPDKALYKIYFTFKSQKFVAEVYNEKYMCVYPWDGAYERDYINMDSLPVAYNIFIFSKTIIPRD
jgi:hypothetical protein